MKKMRYLFPALLSFYTAVFPAKAQNVRTGNNKSCAVVLTYDDAIDVDLDHAIPVLDSLSLKATFYMIGSSPVVNKRLNEWRVAAQHGHELGNHTLCHPCDGSKPGRGWITAENDLSKYTVGAVNEARLNNTLLKAIDGKDKRTFAYPSGGHNLNVDLGEHSKLLHFLHEHEKTIWIAPMVDVAGYIADTQKTK